MNTLIQLHEKHKKNNNDNIQRAYKILQQVSINNIGYVWTCCLIIIQDSKTVFFLYNHILKVIVDK